MAKKLNSVLGVDIGSQRIKVAEVRAQGRDAVVTALGMIPTPEGAVDHTGIYNSEAVGAAIKQCIADSGGTCPFVIASISGQASVLVRTLEVPRMNPAELKEHMQWEINRNIPFAESNVVSDFRPLQDGDPNSANMDVVMAISPQSAIDTMIACIKKAGKNLAAIDVEPLAIARSLQLSYGDMVQNETVCIVEMGHRTTSINIYKDGKLLMPRQVAIGGEMFTKAIADALTISMTEAENIKVSKADIPDTAADAAGGPPVSFGVPGATQEFTPYNPFGEDQPAAPATPAAYNPFADASIAPAPGTPEPADAAAPAPAPAAGHGDGDSLRVYNAFAPVLDEFVAEVRRSIDYFRSRGGDVNRIFLCGGAARIGGLTHFLSKTLGATCDNYDALRRLNVSAKKVAPDYIDEHRQEFVIAVGNALHILFD
ncbi:MAG TPA: type IV pilus assembly protein PilM [Fimbriimonadaceae bacterium]|nr:type IV pilus assembly protein PilM [Fimbriimonadaceae bacterium]